MVKRPASVILLSSVLALCMACGRERRLPARRLGVLAPTVDSALAMGATALCYRIPFASQTRERDVTTTGCHLSAGDTLFYFYVRDDGQVVAWGRSWHVPDSTRLASLQSLAGSSTVRQAAGSVCPAVARAEGLRVWRAAGYFIYAFADSEATRLGGAENLHMGARLGAATCTLADNVSPPFLR